MEEVMRTAEREQGDGVNNGSGVDTSNSSPTKRRRGRPQGSKKLKVCVTDVNLMELVSGISNGGSTQPRKRRGRPKLSGTKHTEQHTTADNNADDSVQAPRRRGRPKGSKKQGSDEDIPMTVHSPKKRGRPKKSLEKAPAEDLPNGGSDPPKLARGRPKGSRKRKSESITSGEENEGSPAPPRKRGRPKGSLNKTPRLERELASEWVAEAVRSLNSLKRGRGRPRKFEVNDIGKPTQDTSNGFSKIPRRARGRPRKITEQESVHKQELVTDGSHPVKRGRGRPKGSLNKKHPKVGQPWTVHVSVTKRKRGRPKKQPAKRGRPRKYPLPLPEELKKPKVWKPLGRPRKYPRVELPEGDLPAPRRSRGRPRKSESKKGAHLRKSLPATPSSPPSTNHGSQRKRGRPPISSKSEQKTSRKRGRPKGSVNKNKARGETRLEGTLRNHSKSNSSASGLEEEDQMHDTDIMGVVNTYDAGHDVSSQA